MVKKFKYLAAGVAGLILCFGLSGFAAAAGAEGGSMDDKKALKDKLSPQQFSVMCESGTEPAFKNKYWDNHKPGIYVNAVTGEPLFSSTDKFDSGTGWPSFTKPIIFENVVEKKDMSGGMERTEVRSKEGDFHLGHVFNDGPKPTGARYCINSASLRFVPAEGLEKEGYGKYAALFERTEKAAFAGGCFWGTEAAFSQIKGVKKTSAGYMGGSTRNPT